MNVSRWLIGFGFLFVILTLLSNIMQGVYFGTDELYFIEAMNDFKLAFTDISLGSVFNIMSGLGNIAQAFWQWLTWDYSFFYGSWEMFRYLLMTISFGFVVSFGIELASVLRWI